MQNSYRYLQGHGKKTCAAYYYVQCAYGFVCRCHIFVNCLCKIKVLLKMNCCYDEYSYVQLKGLVNNNYIPDSSSKKVNSLAFNDKQSAPKGFKTRIF